MKNHIDNQENRSETLPILQMLKTPEDIIGGAHTYLTINTMCSLAPIVYNMTAYLMSSLGDSKGLTCYDVLHGEKPKAFKCGMKVKDAAMIVEKILAADGKEIA